MIKNIIFDLSEVIISGYIGAGVGPLMEKKYGIPTEEFRVRKREKNDTFLELMRGKITEEEYCSEVLEGMEWDITIEDFKETIREYLNQPVKGTMEIIKQLKGKYQLVLFSDNVREWIPYIEERNKDISIFEQKIFSYEIGTIKTDEQTFITVLNKTKIIADETLFIDDNEENIKRAEEVGIHGILFKDAEQLKEELIKREIL